MSLQIFRIGFALLVLATGAFASTDAAQNRLTSAVDSFLKEARSAKSTAALQKAVQPLLYKNISFEAMTRRAVGPGWREFTDSQRKRATELFSALIIRTYCSKFTIGEKPEVEFKAATEPAPGRVEIPTTVLYKGSRYLMLYRLEKNEGWRITDILVEGVSLIANYRSQFNAAFASGGPDGVIRALEKSVNTQP